MSEIYLNGKFVGEVSDRTSFVDAVRSERRKGVMPDSVNIHNNELMDAVFLTSSKGRLRRPLIVVNKGKPSLSESHIIQLEKGDLAWPDLVKQGIVEYLDASEEENSLVAFFKEDLTEEHTHLEITPLSMVGLCTSLVPFGNYNHGVRLLQGSKNQKQAIGFYTTNFPLRIDMDVSFLHTPQVPITTTYMYNIAHFDKHPSGQNLVVAIMCQDGYNMEDAIILNKGSIERGLARSTYYRPAITEELRYSGGLTDDVSVPDKEVKGYRSEEDYKYLEPDGIIYPEAPIKEGDVVIGKTSPPRFLSSLEEYDISASSRRESSLAMKHGEQGVVDFVSLTENQEGNKLVQVRIRDQRVPEIGDKFTSRHGQKGVIGLIVPHSEMPFSSNGTIPDLIFSPYGVPTRMTLSHLLELIGGKVGSLSGRFINGTTFESEKEEDLRKELLSYGFREDGTETLYNGRTGERFKVKIYVGNMYYLKLKHMVANRQQARARGPVQLLTRQPTEGRAKEGGLRLGEMEKDTLIAHGTSLLLKERFDSDKTVVPVCEDCGLIAVYNEFKNQSFCQICGDNVEINNIELSYAFKLMLDELKAMGVYPKLNLENKY